MKVILYEEGIHGRCIRMVEKEEGERRKQERDKEKQSGV